MIILAVESSCDETSVAVVKDGKEVLSNVIFSQIEIHRKFGGVVPEIAARNHVKKMLTVLDEAITISGVSIAEIDAVAVTNEPGLIGALLVGINAASAFALVHDKPLIPVNHLLGHIYSASIENEMIFPAVCLLISGGHTELLLIRDHLDIVVLGTTLDDAVGEAYDKVARTLNLGYPGGPKIDKLSITGVDRYQLPRPLNDATFNFSFSGLKSAVINMIHNASQKGQEIDQADMAASFQASVLDVLMNKTKNALQQTKAKQLIVVGGVAANRALRKRIEREIDIDVIIPSLEYCTDNAAMIGAAAEQIAKNKEISKNYLVVARSTTDLKGA